MEQHRFFNRTRKKYTNWEENNYKFIWIPELSKLSYDELLQVFEEIIIQNNWSREDIIIANPRFEDDARYVFINGIIEEKYSVCCDYDYPCSACSAHYDSYEENEIMIGGFYNLDGSYQKSEEIITDFIIDFNDEYEYWDRISNTDYQWED